MSDVIGIAVERWSWKKLNKATNWLHNNYGPEGYPVWYMDYQPMCTDLVMREDVYFMFLARFGQDYATS